MNTKNVVFTKKKQKRNKKETKKQPFICAFLISHRFMGYHKYVYVHIFTNFLFI
ncbi:hypothetical protein [Plasmodium yoelii yoelii]|uniref:Uncharacterized protein n=1 Tax=Plasmodium yoelii yoelii TaxID=73239 RepID=Q7RQR7_PLAYO|nr:hypothetical protein [Plasmodium yoelii yoelii]